MQDGTFSQCLRYDCQIKKCLLFFCKSVPYGKKL